MKVVSIPILWDEFLDSKLLPLRDAGCTYEKMGKILGMTPDQVRYRFRTLGISNKRLTVATSNKDDSLFEREDNKEARQYDPLPAGHPISWGAISRTPWPGY